MPIEPREYRFGDILRHPNLPEIMWMIVCPSKHGVGQFMAMRISTRPGTSWAGPIGAICKINGAAQSWIRVDSWNISR